MPRRAAALVLAFLAVQLLRCGGGDDGGGGGGPSLPDVIYDGGASDEAWEVVWPKLASATPKDALQLTSPQTSPGASVPASPPPTFTWTAQAAAPRAPGSAPGAPGFPGTAWPLPLGPAVAAAHEPPVTGTVVLLEITGAKLVRVFTDRDSWTPGDADWQAITGGAERQVSVRLYSAYLNENVIEEGPFRSPEVAKFLVRAP